MNNGRKRSALAEKILGRLRPHLKALLIRLTGIDHDSECPVQTEAEKLAIEAYRRGLDGDDLLVGAAGLRLFQYSMSGVMISITPGIGIMLVQPTIVGEREIRMIVMFLLAQFNQERTMDEYTRLLTDANRRWAELPLVREA